MHLPHGMVLAPSDRKRARTPERRRGNWMASSTSPGKASPGLGEHNDEVFKELGFELNEIERLSASGVIAKPAAPAKAA